MTSPSKKVFIVHGRDHNPVNDLKKILAEFGLNPMVLEEQASGSLTIIEKLEKFSKQVGFAFVVLTPDDVGTLRNHVVPKLDKAISELSSFCEALLIKPLHDDTPPKIEAPTGVLFDINFVRGALMLGRARPNVIMEFGLMIGLLGRDKVCCLCKGDVERPSNMEGIVFVPFNESVSEVKDKIAMELEGAGYVIQKRLET